MIVLPAIDLLNGKVVQLVGGRPGTEQVVLPNPQEVAWRWQREGAPGIHVVDLDAALGKGGNRESIRSILEKVNIPVQVGGGIRDSSAVESILDMGASKVIVGTRGITDPRWLREVSLSNPQKIILAMDVRGGKIQLKGWQESSRTSTQEVLQAIADLPLAGVLHTNVDVEGRAAGIDGQEMETFLRMCPHPVIASGGITTMEDIRTLQRMGVQIAVVGLALYTNKIDTAEIWG
jgi:phosphoribosylformimino-5-aminoimidazole carboxamide ribotide isomerase